jgi:hypothetical protein
MKIGFMKGPSQNRFSFLLPEDAGRGSLRIVVHVFVQIMENFQRHFFKLTFRSSDISE